MWESGDSNLSYPYLRDHTMSLSYNILDKILLNLV